jgi:hypothetical protein
LGSFGPGDRKRAMMPAMNPITMIQMMFDTTISCDFDAGVRPSFTPAAQAAARKNAPPAGVLGAVAVR